jgi:uncharacterized OB-fold protein
VEVLDARPWTRAMPACDGDYRDFFQGCADGRLLIQVCLECVKRQSLPRPWCGSCDAAVEWMEASGEGTLHTFTVIRRTRERPFADQVPYIVGVVELPEGPKMLGTVTGVGPEMIQIGQRFKAYAVLFAEGLALPQWRPV